MKKFVISSNSDSRVIYQLWVTFLKTLIFKGEGFWFFQNQVVGRKSTSFVCPNAVIPSKIFQLTSAMTRFMRTWKVAHNWFNASIVGHPQNWMALIYIVIFFSLITSVKRFLREVGNNVFVSPDPQLIRNQLWATLTIFCPVLESIVGHSAFQFLQCIETFV